MQVVLDEAFTPLGEIGKQLLDIESQNKSDGVAIDTLTTQQGLTGSDNREIKPRVIDGEVATSFKPMPEDCNPQIGQNTDKSFGATGSQTPSSPECFEIYCECGYPNKLEAHFSQCPRCFSTSYHITKPIEVK